ncbi:hypothetical protein D1P53_005287 [Cryptococcus gattii VGV]|nr:hypothetical protein D1P53_005287 [Cryptococcus gattii VGV]
MRFPLLPLAALELPVPTAHLEWKQANFISISDSHGKYPDPSPSGNMLIHHSHRLAPRTPTWDHHDGSGLVSSSPDSASLAEDIFSMIQYDVITIGNHELYHYADALDIYENQERWGGRYVTSNVNITVEREGEWQSVPIGHTHLKFTTKQGYNVTAFGVIFNFKAHDKGITVQKPSKLAREPWFREAIRDAPDYFILSGHMPVRGEIAEFAPVFDAIRDIHPKVPIYIFGGHTHVRDCVQYDERSIGVVPGKYLETVAFTSSSLPSSAGDDRPLDVARRYLDGNPTSTSAFLYTRLPASLTRNITDQMNRAGASKLMPTSPVTPYEEEQRVKRIYDKWMYEQWQAYEREIAQEGDTQKVMVDKGKDKPRTLGHVTRDKCPGTGDDIAHIPVPFYPDQPDFISTPFPSVAEDEEIDVVCMDFALDDFLTAVNTLDPARNLEAGMMKPYAKGLRINTVFGKYAQKYWRAETQE